MPRPNLSSLISEEMKRRFDTAIKDEIAEFNRRHQDYLNRIESLDKYSKGAVEDVRSEAKTFALIYSKQEKMYEEFKNYILELQTSQSHAIKKMVKDVEAKLDKFHSEKDKFLTTDNVQKELKAHLDDMDSVISTAVKELRSYKDIATDMWKRIEIYCNQEYNKIYDLFRHHRDKIDKLETKLLTFKIDSDGVLRELQVYKKSMFIIEKKIEDLYDKLGRLK